MEKDFEKWLRQDELFEYYESNPEQQESIFNDYRREKEYIKPQNINEWVWMTRNPELAEKHYPELMQGLTQRIKNSEPFVTALIIQELPDHFPKWKTEADQYFGIKRTKMIQSYIDLIKVVLVDYESPSEIEQQGVESVRPELTELLEYWEKELKALPPQQKKTKTI
jgi:hypothetical protein